jgi:EmrB/QacA subfamily drug resistance transporter
MPSRGGKWTVLGVLCLIVIVASLDNTVLNVALPVLARDLNASNSQLQWIVDTYSLVFAGLLLSSGALSDRHGRRLGLTVGMALFAVGSIWAILSGSAGELIAARAVTGVGGAALMPATLAILTNVFGEEERPRAIAIWGVLSMLGFASGPIVGGLLLRHFGWQSVFAINLPIIALALLGTVLYIPESRAAEPRPLDVRGTVLSGLGIAALVYAIIEIPVYGWTSSRTLAGFTAAVLLLSAFAWWQRRTPHPLLPYELWHSRAFDGASFSLTLVFFSLAGGLFLMTQYFQLVRGWTPLHAGIATLPTMAGSLVGAPVAPRLLRKLGARTATSLGLFWCAVGLSAGYVTSRLDGYLPFGIGLAVVGYGMATAMTPVADLLMGSFKGDRAGVGSAVNDTTQEIGGALGVAVLGSIVGAAYPSGIHLAAAPAAAHRSLAAALAAASKLPAARGAALAAAARSSFLHAFGIGFLLASALALASAALAYIVLPGRVEAHEAGSGDSGRAARLQLTNVD